MDTTLFFLSIIIGVPISAIYMYRKRIEADMTSVKRLLGFAVLLVVGIWILSYSHGAFEARHIACGKYGRLDCDQDADPFFFWVRSLFTLGGGIFAVAGAIVTLIRPDSAGEP